MHAKVLFPLNKVIILSLIREHFVIQLIMKISEIKLRRFEVILTPLSSNYSCSFFEFKYKVTENSDVYISVQRCRCVLNKYFST